MATELRPHEIIESTRTVLKDGDSAVATVAALVRHASKLAGCDLAPDVEPVDLERDIQEIAEQLQFIFEHAPPPPEIEYLLVGSNAIVETDGKPQLYCWLRGQPDYRPDDFYWALETRYSVSKYGVGCRFLDSILPEQDGEAHNAIVWGALVFPAVGVLVRAALRKLGRREAVVVIQADAEPVLFLLR